MSTRTRFEKEAKGNSEMVYWQHLKMATFRAGKLARKKNSRFQSTAVKSRTDNFLDSRKRKPSDSLADAIKVSF